MFNEYLQKKDHVRDFDLTDWTVSDLCAAYSLVLELQMIVMKEGYLTALDLDKLGRHLSEYIDDSISAMLAESEVDPEKTAP